jgi:hypothetical protein
VFKKNGHESDVSYLLSLGTSSPNTEGALIQYRNSEQKNWRYRAKSRWNTVMNYSNHDYLLAKSYGYQGKYIRDRTIEF